MKRGKRAPPDERIGDGEESDAVKKKKGHSRVGHGGIPQLNPFVEMLKETTVEDAVPSRKVIVLDDTNTVSEALQLLAKYAIRSAPVLDLVKRGFLGFVDVLDILSYIVSFFPPGEEVDNSVLFERSQEAMSRSVVEVIGKSYKPTALDINRKSSLWEAITVFQCGAHRLAVTNEDGVIVNLISQMDILLFFRPHFETYSNLFESTVKDLKMGRHRAVSFECNQPTLHALRKMQNEQLSALAIVNKMNELVGNLSASDLKGATITDDTDGAVPLGSLMLPVLSFLQQNGKRFVTPTVCTDRDSLGNVLAQMMERRFHRVWVVDDQNHPKSVITITDVMKAIIQQKPKEFVKANTPTPSNAP